MAGKRLPTMVAIMDAPLRPTGAGGTTAGRCPPMEVVRTVAPCHLMVVAQPMAAVAAPMVVAAVAVPTVEAEAGDTPRVVAEAGGMPRVAVVVDTAVAADMGGAANPVLNFVIPTPSDFGRRFYLLS